MCRVFAPFLKVVRELPNLVRQQRATRTTKTIKAIRTKTSTITKRTRRTRTIMISRRTTRNKRTTEKNQESQNKRTIRMKRSTRTRRNRGCKNERVRRTEKNRWTWHQQKLGRKENRHEVSCDYNKEDKLSFVAPPYTLLKGPWLAKIAFFCLPLLSTFYVTRNLAEANKWFSNV